MADLDGRVAGLADRSGDLEGCQVWLEVQASREQAGRVDRRALLDRLYAAGAVPGSRVTLSVLPAETARAARIQEVHRLEDKLRVWAEVSGEPAGEGLITKARQLEAEAREEGLAPGGLHIRIRRLFLRGAIGIRKGQGRDEIFLDMDRYAPDLVALVGPNGAGKTTLIENMHPFPEMLTRAGKLQDHFYLRDSCRDLVFSDERTGDEYRALIRIDGQNPSGKVDYHLYRNGEPLTNGRREDYQRRVQELFGSLALFLRSAFVSQKPGRNHPDLSDSTKGEKKALFRELAGLDYLQGYADAAREKARTLEEEADQEGGRVERMREAIADLPQKRARLAELQDAMAARRSELAACEREESRLKDELRRLEERARENRERKSRLEELARQSQDRIEDKKALQEQVERLRAEGSSRGEAETLLARYERLKAEEQRLSGQKTRILEQRERILAGQREKQEILFRRERELERRRAGLQCELAVLQERRAALARRIEERQAGESEEVACPRCGHTFRPRGGPGAAGEAAERSRARALDRQIRRREEALDRLEEAAAGRDDAGLPLPDASRIERKLAVVRERLQRFHPQPAYSLLERIHAAEGRILETQQRITEIDERLLGLQEETRELSGRLDERPEQAILPAERALQAAVERRGAVREDLIRLEQDTGYLREETGALESLSDRLERALQSIGRNRQETADWRLLERACGPDGIQALELDAMGPGIAEVANRLLQAAYGSRFQIEFRTTRMGGLGSRRRQIEDFQIWIFDLESATEQLLETLSGGEAVWVKRAIYDAFGIIRDRNTGQRFLTAFQDEADGALDMEARLAYFQMLREAHRQSGRRHTIVITHSQEAQEMIPQRIVIGELEHR
jgi:exonuclease SbcC